MIAYALAALLAASALLAGAADAQIINTDPQLSVELVTAQPVHYVDEEGYTVVVGEVRNLRNAPVTDVRVLVSFYTAESGEDAAETKIGNTILEVIPPLQSSPFIARSPSPDLDVVGISPNLLGFTSSSTKSAQLEISKPDVRAFDRISITGSVSNASEKNAENPKVYALLYDSFEPPRLVRAYSLPLAVSAGGESDYEFLVDEYEQASFVRIVAESDNFTSEYVDAPIVRKLLHPVSIRNITTLDFDGDAATSLREGVPVYIQSTIAAEDGEGADYRYIVQVKRSTALPIVEFIGQFEGKLLRSGVAQPVVEWTPESAGLFFVETFVWDSEDVPISTPGPVALLHVR